MKQLISLMALGLALAVSGAHAAEEKAPTTQQNKMKTCNADAKTKDLKGDERKTFMKECLSAKKEVVSEKVAEKKADVKEKMEDKKDAVQTQQNKMKSCNADPKAKALKGDERKKFMSECLKA